jgi:predicted PurR-regulated permease PerM
MTQRELVVRTVTVLSLIALAVILAWFVRSITDILILLLVSAILAAGLSPVVSLVERWRLPGGTRLSRGLAIFFLYLALLSVIGGILSIIIVPAVNETAGFLQNLPDFLGRLRVWLVELRIHFPWLPDLTRGLDTLPQQIVGLSRYGSEAANVAFRFLGGLASIFTVLVFTFYMLLEGSKIEGAILAMLPATQRPLVDRVMHRIGGKFGAWLRGQLLLSFTIASLVTLGLLLPPVHMPYPALLGIVAGVGELIPVVGLSLAAAVAILVALSQGTATVVYVVIFYTIAINLDTHILAPRIMSRAVGTSPLLTLFALLAGIKILGILGGLLAVPLAAALQVIVSEVAQVVQQVESPGDSTPDAVLGGMTDTGQAPSTEGRAAHERPAPIRR